MTSSFRRIALVSIAAAAYIIGLWPSWYLRDAVLHAFGNPPYQGLWLLIPHLLLYSTLQALFCLAAWSALVRWQWMAPLHLSFRWRTFGWGLATGLASIAIVIGYFFATGQTNAFHAARLDTWSMAANVFSNFYEEYVFRGFILAALIAALGFWPAAILSAFAFGAVHQQYPLALRATIAVVAVIWAWSGKRAGGLLAPYTAHMTLDWVIDPFV